MSKTKKIKGIIDDGCSPELITGANWAGELELPCLSPPEKIIIPSRLVPFSKRTQASDNDAICFYEPDENFSDVLRTPIHTAPGLQHSAHDLRRKRCPNKCRLLRCRGQSRHGAGAISPHRLPGRENPLLRHCRQSPIFAGYVPACKFRLCPVHRHCTVCAGNHTAPALSGNSSGTLPCLYGLHDPDESGIGRPSGKTAAFLVISPILSKPHSAQRSAQ